MSVIVMKRLGDEKKRTTMSKVQRGLIGILRKEFLKGDTSSNECEKVFEQYKKCLSVSLRLVDTQTTPASWRDGWMTRMTN